MGWIDDKYVRDLVNELYDYVLKLQIYRKKLRLAIKGLIVWLCFSTFVLLAFRVPISLSLLVFLLLSNCTIT